MSEPLRSGLGATFKRLLRKIVIPNNAVVGQTRFEIGVEVPAELFDALKVEAAIVAYVIDTTQNLELGYFYLGIRSQTGSNQDKSLIMGNVTYPTLGDPSSPTTSDVKVNVELKLWSQWQQTIFWSDHFATFWKYLMLQSGVSTDIVLRSRLTASGSFDMFRIILNGMHTWGPGDDTFDTNLYRSGSNELKTDDSFVVGSKLTVIGDASDVLPGSDGINNAAVTSGTDTTTSASFTNLAGTGSIDSFTFTKKYESANSKLRVRMDIGAYVTGATAILDAGVLVNGVDHQIIRFFFNTITEHNMMGGTIHIAGLAAGTYTIQGRWRRPSGTGTLTRDSNDRLSIDVLEVTNDA